MVNSKIIELEFRFQASLLFQIETGKVFRNSSRYVAILIMRSFHVLIVFFKSNIRDMKTTLVNCFNGDHRFKSGT